MFSKIKKALSKGKKKLIVMIMASFMTFTALAVSASAAEDGSGSSTGSSLEQVIGTAGETIKTEFTVLVNTLLPVAIGIGIVGLGMYAIIYLFKIAKKFFATAAK